MYQLVTAQAESLHRELIERNVDLLIAARWGSPFDERLEFETLFADQYFIVSGADRKSTRLNSSH